MKPASRVRPDLTITVTGRVTWRMRAGLLVMRLGARLVRDGGVKVTYRTGAS